MINLSKADFIKQIITKEPKLLAKTLSQPSLSNKPTPHVSLIQTLLHSLSKEETLPTSVQESLKTTSWAKNSPSFTNELRSLVDALEKDSSLKHLASSLKRFLSTPNETNKPNLQNRLINSGIFYESNLKDQMLPVKSQITMKDLETYLPKAPLADNFKKDIKIQIKNLLEQEKPSLKSFENTLKLLDKSLKHAQKHLSKNHPLLLVSKSLKNAEENLQKLTSSPSLVPKTTSLPSVQAISKTLLANLVKNELNFKNLPAKEQKILIEVKNILIKLTQTVEPKPIKPNYITEKIPLHPKQKSVNFKPNVINETKISTLSQPIAKSSSLKQNLEYKIPLTLSLGESFGKNKEDIAFAWISKLTLQEPSSASKDLQTKLLEAISKLKEIIKNQDNTALKLPAALKHVSDLSAQIKSSLSQIDPKTNMPKDESSHDIKRTLLSVERATKSGEGQIAREAHAIASKALNQIDFHQLYSYVNQYTHTYLPYLWGGLQGGAIQFKKEGEQMYCKIDLEFEKYKKVEILIALFDKCYISLTAAIEHPELFSRIKANLKTLRELLSSANLVPHTITLLPALKEMPYESFNKEDVFGFDFKA